MNRLFPSLLSPLASVALLSPQFGQVGGGIMPERIRAFLKGSEDAHPGDYLVAIVAVLVVMSAIGVIVLRDLI
jgi:hypothetical protein